MNAASDLQPTFVITTDGDVDLYKTVEDAASSIEAVDVRDGEHQAAFSISGERLDIVVDGDQVSLVATGTPELARLQELLSALAARNGYRGGDEPDPRVVANDVLVNQWRARWPRWPRWLDRRLHGDGPLRV